MLESNAKTGLTSIPACKNTLCAVSGTETAVSFDKANFTSGGGFSVYSKQPSYQKTAVDAYLNSGVKLPPSTY